MTQEKNLTRSPSGRVKRTPVGVRNRLSVSNKDPNYEYRIVNDIDDRIEDFKGNGWEVDTSEATKVGDKRVEQPSKVGSANQVSVGSGTKAIVMRIRKDWYAEDQESKQAQIDRTEQAMKQDALSGNYGKLEISRS